MFPVYGYFLVALCIAGYLVFQQDIKYKLELFLISFYLMTGNLNEWLTIKIPGFGLFEIQPDRLIFFVLCFFLVKKLFLSKEKILTSSTWTVPWFQLGFYIYIFFIVFSLLSHVNHVGVPEVIAQCMFFLSFLVLFHSLGLLTDIHVLKLIGNSIIIGAVFTSLISIVQIAVDPYFMRWGVFRPAFGTFIRSNGIFSTEYFNAYFLIIATCWSLFLLKKRWLKTFLVCLFTIGVITCFHRMSMLVMVMVFGIYIVFYSKMSADKIVFAGLTTLAVLIGTFYFFEKDILESSIVKERLTDKIDSRIGYYSMVINNIGDKPVFGYGDNRNDVYYNEMLRITRNRDRASGERGSIHNGYLSTLFFYGIPAFLCFIWMLIASFWFFKGLSKSNYIYAIPLFVCLLYLLGNLTNTLSDQYLTVLFVYHLGLGVGIRNWQISKHRNENYLNQIQ